ncbi:MAG TPA: LysM peptidoglycan-binding domain-containing protein [Candidatus Saccharimonadales bacterium]|nr:LysM peptidoglycan-binding domain-containing protein [Candidatus Saccharimonadales bacterium]
MVASVVVYSQHTTASSGDPAPLSSASAASSDTANPLDQLSSADIAQTVAQVNNLPETTAVANQAQSQAADIAMASTDNDVISKPQVVATSLKSKSDIQTYVTQAGDTVSALAAKFGVTSDSIRWSNSLSASDALNPGTTLVIPPVNGVVYTIKPGDTAASLAVQFGASEDQIIAYNDAEIGGLTPGEQIIIPNAAHNNAGATAASVASSSGVSNGAGFLWGSGPIYGYNGYDYGYCTWYVATQLPVPANWGNASTWAYYAALSGWNVSTMPSVGSIAQTANAAGGEGHVAIVTGVNPDGTINIRDMNGLAGWGRVGYGTVSASHFQHFISR